MAYDTLFDTEENKLLLAVCTRRLIRDTGTGALIVGIISIFTASASLSDSIFRVFLMVQGILLLGLGIYTLRKPSLTALWASSIMSVLVFILLFFLVILNIQTINAFNVILPLLTGISLGNYFWKALHVRDSIESMPSHDIEKVEEKCKEFLKKHPDYHADMIHTTDRTCFVELKNGKALFVQKDILRAFAAPRHAVAAAIKTPHAKKLTLTFNHPIEQLSYTFDRQNSGVLKNWLYLDTLKK